MRDRYSGRGVPRSPCVRCGLTCQYSTGSAWTGRRESGRDFTTVRRANKRCGYGLKEASAPSAAGKIEGDGQQGLAVGEDFNRKIRLYPALWPAAASADGSPSAKISTAIRSAWSGSPAWAQSARISTRIILVGSRANADRPLQQRAQKLTTPDGTQLVLVWFARRNFGSAAVRVPARYPRFALLDKIAYLAWLRRQDDVGVCRPRPPRAAGGVKLIPPRLPLENTAKARQLLKGSGSVHVKFRQFSGDPWQAMKGPNPL